jgi:hypothetical protein
VKIVIDNLCYYKDIAFSLGSSNLGPSGLPYQLLPVGGIKYLENKYLQVIMITKYLRPATWTLNYLQVITWKIWKGQVLAITCFISTI